MQDSQPSPKLRGKIVNDNHCADDYHYYHYHSLEESGQWLENVDRTHLVLEASQYYKKIYKTVIKWALYARQQGIA